MNLPDVRKKASEIWKSSRRGRKPLTQDEKETLRDAYWCSALPRDPDYDLGQWVEDGMPEIGP